MWLSNYYMGFFASFRLVMVDKNQATKIHKFYELRFEDFHVSLHPQKAEGSQPVKL
jgi:hypothetical protein